MKIAQFLCFSPDLAEERISAVQILPELPPCKRHRRWRRRRLAGAIFPVLITPPPIQPGHTSPASKSDFDDVRGSDEAILSPSSSSSPKTQSFSPLISPIVPARKSAAEDTAEKRCALCFLLLSLMIMVFCGRICAILWTASGLCFLPRRKPPLESPESGGGETPAAAPAACFRRRGFCEDDKRRVVLEGFLGRSKRV